MSDIDTARLRAEIAEWRAVGFKTDDYPLDTVRLMRLLDRIDSLERTAAAAGRALQEAQRDAGRYQWLRAEIARESGIETLSDEPTVWDIAVDDAIAAKEQNNG